MSTPVPLKKKLEPAERQRELQMMNQKYPGGWPRWPFLPMKRSMTSGFPETGVLLDTGPLGKGVEVHPIIYEYQLFSGEPFDTKKVVARYNSLEEMVDDGWVVD